MPRIAKYQPADARKKLLAALRGGASRQVAAETIGAELVTFLGWIDRDPVLAAEVQRAELDARGEGAAPTPQSEREPQTGDRWTRIREEAAKLGPGLTGIVLWVDGLLVQRGFPPMSPWWREAIASFLAGDARWLILQVGRRGGKSSTLCRVAVVLAIFGEHTISPGDPLVWPVFSVDMAEARGRLAMISAVLKALGVDYEEGAFQGRPRILTSTATGEQLEFRVFPATKKGARGFTAPGATCDEEAHWDDEESHQNPSREVLRALGPTMATQPRARAFRCSSPFARMGTHHIAVQEGDTRLQSVARLGAAGLMLAREGFERVAMLESVPERAATIRAHSDALTERSPEIPSWVANPTLDPVATRLDEPDLGTWLREYGSVPTGLDGATFFDGPLLDAASAASPARGDGECFAAIDPGSRKNAFALAVVRKIEGVAAPLGMFAARTRKIPPVLLREWIPTPGNPLDLRMHVLPEVMQTLVAYGCSSLTTDAHALTEVELVAAEHGIRVRCRAEVDAYEQEYRPVRDGIHRGECPLSGCAGAEELVRQLRLVRSVPGAGGHTKIIVADDGPLHGDLQRAYVSAAADAGAGAPIEERGPGISARPGRYANVDPRRS